MDSLSSSNSGYIHPKKSPLNQNLIPIKEERGSSEENPKPKIQRTQSAQNLPITIQRPALQRAQNEALSENQMLTKSTKSSYYLNSLPLKSCMKSATSRKTYSEKRISFSEHVTVIDIQSYKKYNRKGCCETFCTEVCALI